MNKLFRVPLSILLALFMTGILSAQDAVGSYPQLGVTPTTAYHISNIDRVDTQTGNMSLDIPLYSLPQKGRLKLSFSVFNNSTAWIESYTCPDVYCYYSYNPAPNNIGFPGQLFIQMDQDASGGPGSVTVIPLTVPCGAEYCAATYQTNPIVQDSRFGRHPLAQDANDLHRFRATDGSGYMLYTANDPRNTASNATASYSTVDTSGISASYYGTAGSGGAFGTVYSDLFGHQITRNYQDATYTDSLGRSVADPQSGFTSSTARCPTPSGPNQPLVGSSQWTPPHSYGTGTYTFCFASVSLNTYFFAGEQSYCNGPDGGVCFDEYQGGYNAISAIVLPDGSAWTFTYDSANPSESTSYAYGEITSVGYPTGGSVSYSYVTQPTCAGGTGPWSSFSRVIKSRTENDGNGHSSTWNYDIGYPAGSGGQTSGTALPTFSTTVHSPAVADPANPASTHRNDIVYTYTDQGQVPQGNPSCNYALQKEDHYEGPSSNGQLLESIATTYNHSLSPSAYPFFQSYTAILPTLKATTILGAGTTNTQIAYSGTFQGVQAEFSPAQEGGYTYLSTPAQTIPLGTANDTSVTDYDGSSILKATHVDYVWELDNTYYQANLLNLPGVQTISGPYNALSTTYCYDNSSVRAGCHDPLNLSPTGALGDLTKVSRGGVTTSTYFTYDGMPSTSIDGNGNLATTQYDSTTIFPISTSRGGLTDNYSFDPVSGNVTSHTDPNNVTTTLTYADPLDRLTMVQSATGLPDETDRQFFYPNPTAVTIKQDKDAKGDGVLTTSIVTDGLGRTIYEIAPSGSSVKTVYTAEGHVQAKSNPFVSSPSAFVSYVYDALGRMTIACDQDNGQSDATVCIPNTGTHAYKTYSYLGNSATVTDELSHAWKRTSDALNRLTNVVEPNGAQTTYGYDVFGNLMSVTQPGIGTELARPVRSFHYDALSRLGWSFNPETGWTCYGTTGGQQASDSNCTPAYDGNGNLQYKTDARGATLQYQYDSLNRLTAKVPVDSSSVKNYSCYRYDSSSANAPYFKGHLAEEWTQMNACDLSQAGNNSKPVLTHRTIVSFTATGRVERETRCIAIICNSSTPVSLTNSYDLAGDILSYSTGAAGLGLFNQYNSGGQLYQVSSDLVDINHPQVLYSVSNFHPAGFPQNYVLGRYTSVVQGYDTRLRPTGLMATQK